MVRMPTNLPVPLPPRPTYCCNNIFGESWPILAQVVHTGGFLFNPHPWPAGQPPTNAPQGPNICGQRTTYNSSKCKYIPVCDAVLFIYIYIYMYIVTFSLVRGSFFLPSDALPVRRTFFWMDDKPCYGVFFQATAVVVFVNEADAEGRSLRLTASFVYRSPTTVVFLFFLSGC